MSSSAGFVAFVGSRGWSFGVTLVQPLVGAVLGAGWGVGVGCCVGTDVAVLQSALALGAVSRLQLFCAFGPGGVGAGPWSATPWVARLAQAGASVSWWAGGSASVPLPARLSRRTRALVSSPQCRGLVCFLAAAPGPHCGSWGAVSFAAARQLPVVVVAPWASGLGSLPVLGAGSWQACFAAAGIPAFQWAPAQQSLGLSSSRQPALFPVA